MLTSGAIFAPINTAHSMLRVRRITFDIRPVVSELPVTSRPYTHTHTDIHRHIHTHTLSVSLSLCLYVSLCMSLSLSFSLSLFVCLSLCVSVCLSLSVSLPRTRRRIGDRAFSVAAPLAWNRLPMELKLLQSTDSFRRDLKTFLLRPLRR